MASLSSLHILLKLNPRDMYKLFKERELYSYVRIRRPLALRLDGVRFGRVLADLAPRSREVHEALLRAAKEILRELGCECAYVASDEINVICIQEPFYASRHEKLISVSSGLASALVSLALGRTLFFDSRAIVLRREEEITKYILYRARVCFNNYVSTIYHSVFRDRSTPSLLEMLQKLKERNIDPTMDRWRAFGSTVCKVRVPRGDSYGVEYVVEDGFEAAIRCVTRWLVDG